MCMSDVMRLLGNATGSEAGMASMGGSGAQEPTMGGSQYSILDPVKGLLDPLMKSRGNAAMPDMPMSLMDMRSPGAQAVDVDPFQSLRLRRY